MKESELRSALRDAYGETPPLQTHLAFMHAARSGKDAPPMKRKMRFAPVLALIIVLILAVTAYAVSRFSVTDYAAGGTPSAEFLKHVVTLDQPYENDVMLLSVNDAIYDGVTLSMAMILTAKKPDEHLFLYPRLTATVDGSVYQADVESFGAGDFMSGFVFPTMPGHDLTQAGCGYGFSAVLLDDDCENVVPTSPVQWTFTMQVLKTDYDVAYYDLVLTGAASDPSEEELRKTFQDAYAAHRVLVTDDGSLVEYAAYLPIPQSVPEDEWWNKTLAEQLVLSGAYTLLDTIEVHFETALPASTRLQWHAGDRVPLDGCTAVLDGVDVTFQTVNFAMHYEFDAEKTEEELQELIRTKAVPTFWTAYVDESTKPLALSYMSSGIDWDEGGKPFIDVSGQFTLPANDTLPTRLVLVEAQGYGKASAKESPARIEIALE